MGLGDYARLTPEAIDQMWLGMRAGQAAKPTARELGRCRCGRTCSDVAGSDLSRVDVLRAVCGWRNARRSLAAWRRACRSWRSPRRWAPSTVTRQVSASGGPTRYRAARADHQAWARATRPKSCKLAETPSLRAIVEDKLQRRWSPQQIAGWLQLTHPESAEIPVSHESICRTLYPSRLRRYRPRAQMNALDRPRLHDTITSTG